MKHLLKIQNCYRIYFKGTIQIQAVRNLSFSMRSGELVSIIGRSGSGKSTLLNLIGGLDTPNQGHIWIQDKDLTRMNRTELARHRRYMVGMIFQSFNLIPSRTALENVSLALAFGGKGRSEREQTAIRLLDSVGLKDRMNHSPGELSGGECQRVAIARALANRPLLLLADEPTGNLDSKTAEDILDLLRKLNRKGVSILMVTHDQLGAERISHRRLQLMDGTIIKEEQLRSLHETG
ncbi:ABC transporter ATP-binding protein [bacterium]|nr:ABC transporter ATP-binding protein [bacterium]